MARNEFEVIVVGGGAAGIAAARRLREAGVDCVIVEARARLGGRAWTQPNAAGFPFDLGCGWLHSADRNPWTAIARAQGQTIDTSLPPWMRPAPPHWFAPDEQRAFRDAMDGFFNALGAAARSGTDAASSTLAAPDGHWTAMLNAISTYINGAELDRVSIVDFDRYEDTNVNWRVVEGYGAAVAAHGAELPAIFGAPVRTIDHGGTTIAVETGKGRLLANQVIVTLPTPMIADEQLFSPALPEKSAAAAHLPLGLADKIFLSLTGAEEFEPDTRFFGRTDRAGTGTYHVRPFGRPAIEVYLGGACAAALEASGEAAMVDFAVSEITGKLGASFASRVAPLAVTRWASDPFARGSYSYAVPGHSDDRAVLAAPVDGRLFFVGEACSRGDYSTAHGAYLTGVAAADQAIAVRVARRG